MPAMRKAISDPLARFDPEISMDMSYDSPPTAMRPAEAAEAAKSHLATPGHNLATAGHNLATAGHNLATPGGAGDAPVASSSTPSASEFALARSSSINFSTAFKNSSFSAEKQGQQHSMLFRQYATSVHCTGWSIRLYTTFC